MGGLPLEATAKPVVSDLRLMGSVTLTSFRRRLPAPQISWVSVAVLGATVPNPLLYEPVSVG
jgi:hypothetical protein